MQTTLSILGLVIAVAVVAMAILNFSAWVILRRFPDLLLNENFRNHKKHMARFRGDLKPFVNEWFDLQEGDWDAFEKECTKFQRYGFEHEAFTEFRHRPVQGRFYNISEDGYRLIKNQGPWPIEPKNYNIFLFGGSTAINLGRDETAIPSYLQEVIRERGYDNACVYNFGRGAYFSTQERLLIDKLLAEDIRPDLVIFFDGLNDCIFCDGVPATFGWLSMVWEEFHRKSWGKVDNETLATPQWSLLGEFTSSLPLPQLIGALASRGKSGEVTNESFVLGELGNG